MGGSSKIRLHSRCGPNAPLRIWTHHLAKRDHISNLRVRRRRGKVRDTDKRDWLSIACVFALSAIFGLAQGTVPVLMLLGLAVALTCAVHRPSRAFVLGKARFVFSGHWLRALAIIVGTVMLLQLMPLELGLLMAGDVLAYVEVLAAVSFIAAKTRLGPVMTAFRQRWRIRTERIALFVSTLRRRDRRRRVRRQRPTDSTGDDPAAMPAFFALA